MAHIKTSKGNLYYHNEPLYSGQKRLDKDKSFENLQVLSVYLDKIGICWGPAFGTLIGIVRDDDFQSWAQSVGLFILKEDEERFKDVIWLLMEVGFTLVRYERRGLYTLSRNGEITDFYVLRKISSNIRSTGGRDFINEKYIQNMVKWEFKGIELNVPVELDEYLTFQYGDWEKPYIQTNFEQSYFQRSWNKFLVMCKNSLPDALYYPLILRHHIKDFERFKNLCKEKHVPIPDNVELSYSKPRNGKRVLTVGVYDLLHKGHIELYRRAKGLGDYLIVAVQDGDYILKYKPNANILNSLEDRMYMIKSIRYVDEVVVYKDVDEIVKNIDFDIFVTGPDQNHAGFQRAIHWCEEHGKEHTVLARTDGVSSSELKEKIAQKTRKQ